VNSSVLRIPTDKLISNAIRSYDSLDIVLCTVSTDQGISGTGFTYTIGKAGRSIKSIIDEIFSKALVGSDPTAATEQWTKMWRATHSFGRGGITTHAMAAVDIALWDAKGKECERPLYWLLGGSRKSIPVYDTDGGWLHYSIEELVKNAMEIAAKKFYGFKIKVGKKDLKEDLERIKTVKDAVGKKLTIMIDANQAWSPPEALRRGRKFQDLGVEWYEEPVSADNILAYPEIARQLDVPIAVGETIFTKLECELFIKTEGCNILQHDACRVGGITEWMQISQMAQLNDIKVSPHFVMDLHPALVASIPNGLYIEYIPWLRKLFKNPLEVVDGTVMPPERPGIGLEFDEAAIKKYSVGA